MDLDFWFSLSALIISIVFSMFTLIRDVFKADTSSWNTALTRVGQLYDQASENADLAGILREDIDLEGKIQPTTFQGTPKQDVWLANLFMAYEQIYVAISGARGDSKRAWKAYLKNQLNKPTMRLVFIRDAHDCLDYHIHFIEWVLGKRKNNGEYSGGAINKEIIKKVLK